ncbi:MAG: glycosyltransferase family 4 protein [Nitrososphaerales archaeon]
MKILIVSPFFTPIIGGVESVLETTCAGLTQRGHLVRVLTSSISENEPSIQKRAGYQIQRSDLLRVPNDGVVQPRDFDYDSYASLMNQIIQDFDPSIVHFHNFQMRQYAMFLAAFLSEVDRSHQVAIDTVHNDTDDAFSHYVLSYFPLDQIVTVTNRASLDLMEAGIPPYRISIVPNMLDTEKFRTANGRNVRKMLGLDVETPLILFPSRLVGREGNMMLDSRRGKGLATLFRAMPELLEKVPNAKILLLGNDNVFQEKVSESKGLLKEIATRIGVDDGLLFFDEHVSNDMLPQIFAASNLVVSLSSRETFGMVFLEGMAAGKPVIGVNSQSGGVPEVIQDNATGYLVPENDAHSTAIAIAKILLDEDLKVRFGLNGIKVVRQKFDAKVVLPKLLAIYESLAKQKKGSKQLESVQHWPQKSSSGESGLNLI